MHAPIELTDSAISHIQAIAARRGVSSFRLAVKKDGCSGWSYVMDVVDQGKPGDVLVNCQNLPVYIDPDSLAVLEGSTVDYVCLEAGQKRLVFHNPNVDQTCGCGDSFSVQKKEVPDDAS